MSHINELLGIENGSLLLRQVASFLQESTNDSWVFRMRGSCLVAITRKRADYHALSEKLDKRISQPWTVKNTEVLLQATVCCVVTEEVLDTPITPEEAVNYLETAFRQNERSQNRVKSITVGTELLDKIRRGRAVEAAISEAIESGEGIELGKSGCMLALDDFGTGYANISQVIQLPFSMVQLDRSLLSGSEVVLEDMARMFSSLKRLIVIEGVETAEQAAKMEAIPVDLIQGYYYARPMCQQDFIRFLRNNAKSRIQLNPAAS